MRGTYPRRGTCTSTGPCRRPSLTTCQARVGSRAARAASSRARSPSPTVRTSGAAARTCSRPATSGRAHPLSTSCAASTVQPQLPSRKPHLSWAARSSSTSRAWGCGACCSLWLSSPSSQMATSPRSWTGANIAARVPITARTEPRRTASHCAYRFSGPASAVSTACRPSPSRAVRAASTRATARPSGRTARAPRPEASVATTARASSSLHSGPGSAFHTARGAPPEASDSRKAAPRSYRCQEPAPGAGGDGSGAGERRCSARALRGGTASWRTSARLPAYRSATARDRLSSSSLSTRSGDTTWARAASGPE
ncbi:hypothetical protein SVIOM74S_02174 [Streptomyces violarus]